MCTRNASASKIMMNFSESSQIVLHKLKIPAMLKATAGVLPQSCLWHSMLFSEFRAVEGQGGVEETVRSFLTALHKSEERHKEDCCSAAQNKQPFIHQLFPISFFPSPLLILVTVLQAFSVLCPCPPGLMVPTAELPASHAELKANVMLCVLQMIRLFASSGMVFHFFSQQHGIIDSYTQFNIL